MKMKKKSRRIVEEYYYSFSLYESGHVKKEKGSLNHSFVPR
jgi:hypothetical protein